MISSDLKHVLENIFYDADIILQIPVKVMFNPNIKGCEEDSINKPVVHELKKVYKKGKSWKVCDEWSNEWTLSKLHYMIQWQLYQSSLSMKDSRVTFVQNGVFSIN